MKEIVTGSALIGVCAMALALLLGLNKAHAQVKARFPDMPTPGLMAALSLAAIFVAIACGFSGCGIFIRGVIR